MSVLICKNVSTEGPSTIEEYLNLERIPCTVVELSICEPIPNAAFYDALEFYPNQAFRYGRAAYAFQFHIEVSEQILYDWMAGENADMNKMKVETRRYYDVYRKRAFVFYKHFFRQSTN